MSIYQGQITGSLKVQSSLTGLLYATSGVVSAVGLGVANGVASLDSNGRLPIGQLSVSAMEIKGDWDASLNSPSLSNGTGNMGDVYRCSVAGSVNFGAGSVTFIVGDLVYYTGSVWQIVANSFNLTTSGASGSASLTGRTLNIPTYTLSGLGGTPSTRSLTINGTAYDLSADRSWNIPSSPQARNVTTQTATLNQQVFTVSYTSGQIDVYYNGAYLAPSDYTATNGTSVTLAFQCKAGDVLVFAAYTNTLTIGGAGSTNYMAKWSSSSLLTSSTILYDTGSLLFVNKSTDNGSGAVLQVNGFISQSVTSAILKTDSNGKIVAATAGTDYVAPSGLTSYVPYTGATTNLNLGSNSLTTNSVQFNSISAPSSSEGLLWYDSTQKAFSYYNDITNNILHLGQEVQLKVYNNTGSTIAKGAPVYVTSTSSGFTYPNVALAIANSSATASVIGLANQAIPNATAGYVTLSGLITGVNTGTFTVGDVLYLSPYSAGQLMNTVPPTGYISKVGMVSYVNSSNGTIYVNQNYYSSANPISGSGTTNTLPKFSGSTTIGNSNITDTGSLITLGSNAYVTNNLGLGNSSLTQYGFRNSLNVTGAANSIANYSDGQILSGVVGRASYYETFANTAAAAFTNAALYHYRANQSTFGASSVVTNQYGYSVEATLIGATNNYGFYGNIPSGTNRWNLYMIGTAANYLAGSLGIGTSSLTGWNLRMQKNITGAVQGYGMEIGSVVQSDVTSAAVYYGTSVGTQATTFTLPTLYHYSTFQNAFGSGSTVTTQYGYYAGATLNGATNNYGFYGNLAAASNVWNLYMNGTANNYLAGSLGISTTALTGKSLSVSKIITGQYIFSGGSYGAGIISDGQIQSDEVGGTSYYISKSSTAASSFTTGLIAHYDATQGTFGSGSTVTAQIGFYAESTLTGATSNFGFYGNIASGSNRWNLYMNGTANNYLAGSLGIGSTNVSGINLNLGKTITGGYLSSATYGAAMYLNGAVQSDVTSYAYYNVTRPSTAATAFTVTGVTSYSASNVTVGSGSTISNLIGFWVESTHTGGTNTYGFKSDLAAATNNWNLYMSGTANNYLAGSLGIGTTSLTGYNLHISKNVTGAVTSYGIMQDGVIQSDVTTIFYFNRTLAQTQAATFTIPNITHYFASQGTIGSGSTVTNQTGFHVSSTLSGAGNNYGFRGQIAAATNAYNIYMDGTAQNYLAGNTGIGVAATTTAELSLGAGTTAQAQINLAASTAPTSPVNGDIWFDGTNLKIRVGGVTKTVTII